MSHVPHACVIAHTWMSHVGTRMSDSCDTCKLCVYTYDCDMIVPYTLSTRQDVCVCLCVCVHTHSTSKALQPMFWNKTKAVFQKRKEKPVEKRSILKSFGEWISRTIHVCVYTERNTHTHTHTHAHTRTPAHTNTHAHTHTHTHTTQTRTHTHTHTHTRSHTSCPTKWRMHVYAYMRVEMTHPHICHTLFQCLFTGDLWGKRTL